VAKASRRASAQSQADDITEQALTACDSLLQELAGAADECERLRAAVRTETSTWQHLFDAIPVACLLTDAAGIILEANRAAALFLNVSGRHLRDRPLLVFCDEREAFAVLTERLAASAESNRAVLAMRPRERKPKSTEAIVSPLSKDRLDLWVWFLTPVRESTVTPTITGFPEEEPVHSAG
jgi:PAS domain-containing protein